MPRPSKHSSSLFARRLKEARLRRDISQMRLGVEAGVDEYSASARINQYERGKHMPDVLMARHLARVLKVSAAFFHAESEDEAQLLMGFYLLSHAQRQQVLRFIETRVKKRTK